MSPSWWDEPRWNDDTAYSEGWREFYLERVLAVTPEEGALTPVSWRLAQGLEVWFAERGL